MSAIVFTKFVEIGRQHGVFTLAQGWITSACDD